MVNSRASLNSRISLTSREAMGGGVVPPMSPLAYWPLINDLLDTEGGPAATLNRVSIASVIQDDGVFVDLLFDEPKFTGSGTIVEEGEFNNVLFSRDYSVSQWFKSLSSISNTAELAPDNTSTVQRVTMSSEFGGVSTTSVNPLTFPFTCSVIVKPETNTGFRLSGLGSDDCEFELSTETITNNGTEAPFLLPLVNGWYLIACSPTTGASDQFSIEGLGGTGDTFLIWQSDLVNRTRWRTPIFNSGIQVPDESDLIQIPVPGALPLSDYCIYFRLTTSRLPFVPVVSGTENATIFFWASGTGDGFMVSYYYGLGLFRLEEFVGGVTNPSNTVDIVAPFDGNTAYEFLLETDSTAGVRLVIDATDTGNSGSAQGGTTIPINSVTFAELVGLTTTSLSGQLSEFKFIEATGLTLAQARDIV